MRRYRRPIPRAWALVVSNPWPLVLEWTTAALGPPTIGATLSPRCKRGHLIAGAQSQTTAAIRSIRIVEPGGSLDSLARACLGVAEALTVAGSTAASRICSPTLRSAVAVAVAVAAAAVAVAVAAVAAAVAVAEVEVAAAVVARVSSPTVYTTAVSSYDPNSMVGPAGFGTENFVAQGGGLLPGQLENDPTATAPARAGRDH